MSSLARQPSDDGSEDAKERFQGPNAAGSQTGEASKPATGKRTRNRTPASCDPCRKRKLRCDRLMPCDSCIGRSEADGCTYGEGAAPLHVHGGGKETAELKAQIDRLSQLVDSISRNQAPAVARPGQLARGSSGDNVFHPTPPSSTSPALSPRTPAGTDSDRAQPIEGQVNLKTLDICEALGHLTVNGVLRIDGRTDNVPLLNQAKATINKISGPARTRLGTFPFAATPDSIEKIMEILPGMEQAEVVITCFMKQLSWYIYFFPWSSFYEQKAKLAQSTTADVDCSFLGVFLAVCGIGLYFLPDSHNVTFPKGKEKYALADRYFDAAASALTLAQFLDNPSMNAIHAMQLLTAWHVYLSPGDSSSTGFAILNIAAEAVLQLGLHRDPDPAMYTPFEANCRRSTFWWTVMLETQAGSSLGKTWSLFQLQHCDARFPLEVDEKAFTRQGYLRPDYQSKDEPAMVSILLRMHIAVLSKRISEKAFSIQSVSFSTVLELDRELHKLEDSFPPQYRLDFADGRLVTPPGLSRLARLRSLMTNIGLLQEYTRLHRPFVASGSSYEICRNTCIRASRMTIAIFKELAEFNYGGLTFKAVSCCSVLCMDLMSNPDAEGAQALRQDILDIIALLEVNKSRSKLATNGFSLLNFLYAKTLPPSPPPTIPEFASTGRIDSHTYPIPPSSTFSKRGRAASSTDSSASTSVATLSDPSVYHTSNKRRHSPPPGPPMPYKTHHESGRQHPSAPPAVHHSFAQPGAYGHTIPAPYPAPPVQSQHMPPPSQTAHSASFPADVKSYESIPPQTYQPIYQHPQTIQQNSSYFTPAPAEQPPSADTWPAAPVIFDDYEQALQSYLGGNGVDMWAPLPAPDQYSQWSERQ